MLLERLLFCEVCLDSAENQSHHQNWSMKTQETLLSTQYPEVHKLKCIFNIKQLFGYENL